MLNINRKHIIYNYYQEERDERSRHADPLRL
jgi:hypothetical protein